VGSRALQDKEILNCGAPSSLDSDLSYPNLKLQQNVLINQPAQDYFLSRSQQAKVFKQIKVACKLGWKLETLHKEKWIFHFIVEHLALLLILY
jgi:hypothetical protein